MPFTRDELRYLLENETVFKRYERINIEQFVKNFFPADSNVNDAHESNSSGDDHSLNRSMEVKDSSVVDQRASFTDKRSSTEGDLLSFGGSSLTGSLKQQKVAE